MKYMTIFLKNFAAAHSSLPLFYAFYDNPAFNKCHKESEKKFLYDFPYKIQNMKN